MRSREEFPIRQSAEAEGLDGLLPTSSGEQTSGVSGDVGALFVDPDVVLKARGGDVDIRHMYNSLQGPHSPLGQRWNLSLYGELGGEGFAGVVSRRIHGGTWLWSGDAGGGYLYRYAGCYNTMRWGGGIPQVWEEQTPLGRLLRHEEYAQGGQAPPITTYGHIVSSTDLNGNRCYYSYDDLERLSTVEDPVGREIYFRYGDDGYVDSMTDWAARTHYYEHDNYGNLTKQTGPAGCIYQYEYYPNHFMKSLTDPDGYTTYYEYREDDDRVTAITAANGGTRYYLYDPNYQTRIIDALENTTYYTFDLHHHIRGVKTLGATDRVHEYDGYNRHQWDDDSLGRRTSFTTDYSGNVTSVYDAAGGWTVNEYKVGNPNGNRLIMRRDALGQVNYYSHDDHGNLIAQTDPLLHTASYEYDEYGQRVAGTNALGHTSYFGYDGYGNTIWGRDPLGHAAYFHHDLAGNVTCALDPLGNASYFEYGQRDDVVKATDPLGRVTEFGYDGRGDRTVVLQADGEAVYFDYDAMGKQTRRVDQAFQSWTSEYDLLSNLIAQSNPLGHTAYHFYDVDYRLTASQDPRGYLTYFEYDANGNRTKVTDPLGHITYFTYDVLNRQTMVTDAKSGLWETMYDAVGKTTATINPLDLATYYSYDAADRLIATRTPGGSVTYYLYDAQGQTVGVVDPLGATVYYLYDAAGRRTAVLDPLGHPTYYLYDAAGRQTHEIDAVGHEEVVHYDVAGQVIQRDKASAVGAYYAYDLMGRVTSELRYPSGDTIYYEYDVRGARTSVQKTGVLDEAWQYDDAGRVIRHSQGDDYHLYYEYDENGNRTSLAFVGGGVTYFTYYEYDARNLLSALTDPFGQTVYYERDELGLEIAKLLPNGVTTYHDYDAAGQVTSILHVGPSGLLQSLYYTYDDDGQRTRIVREDGTRIYFGYDAAHRLTGEDWLDPSDVHLYAFAYEYDPAGNRLQKTFNGEVTYYDYNALNQLTTERVLGGGATYYTWTADGAMATKQDVTGWTYYTWDVDESLTKIEAPDVTLDNKYNSRMQRVARDEDGDAEMLVYDSQKLVAEAAAGDLSRYYLSEGGSIYSPLVSQLGSQHWFLFDALGTTLGLTEEDGDLSDTFRYEAFGTSLGRTGATATPYQYVGGYGYFHEPTVGLEQVWYRWYLPPIGGWMSVDPVGFDESFGLQKYAYLYGNPTMCTDPSGAVPALVPIAALIAIAIKAYQAGMLAACVGLSIYSLIEFVKCMRRNQEIGDEITELCTTGRWVYSPTAGEPCSHWHKAFLPDDVCLRPPYSGYADCLGILGPMSKLCLATIVSLVFKRIPWKRLPSPKL